MSSHRLKKIWYQATHRGTQENDMLFARFMAQVGDQLSAEDSTILESLLQEADQDIYHWIMNVHECPERYQHLVLKVRQANALI